MTRRARSLAALALALAASTAQAQPATPVETARAYTDLGLAAERAGDYDAALRFYDAAYELVPHPLLLFDMGQAHRLAGRAEEALGFYQRYLDAEPQEPQRDVARAHVARLEAQLAAARRRAPTVAVDRGDRVDPDAEADDAEATADEQALEGPSRAAGPAPGRRQRVVGASLVAVGVASLAAGAYLELRAHSLAAELSRPGATYDPATFAAGEAAERHGALALAAGGALVIGGTVVYLLARSRPAGDARAVRWTPAVGPRFVGVLVHAGLP